MRGISSEHSFSFLQSVYEQLQQYDVVRADMRLLLAVSGGADSMAMLHAMYLLKKQEGFSLFVVTVNHCIRPESREDADFVVQECAALGIPCTMVSLALGDVEQTAARRKRGIEEAARFLRLQAFEDTAVKVHAHYILTAHTRNDNLETVLMRFFQGSSVSGLQGIRGQRGKYIRPLLTITRDEVIRFLTLYEYRWREDKTNNETRWLRNRIRHILIPALEETFAAYQAGMEKTLEHVAFDESFITDTYDTLKHTGRLDPWVHCPKKEGLICNTEQFLRLKPALQHRFLLEGLHILKPRNRIQDSTLKKLAAFAAAKRQISVGGLTLRRDKKHVRFSLQAPVIDTDTSGYSCFVTSCGTYVLPFGSCIVHKTADGIFLKIAADTSDGIGPFTFPFYIRSRLPGDRLGNKNGKLIKKIMNEGGISLVNRDILPIIEEKGIVRGLYAFVSGGKNQYLRP